MNPADITANRIKQYLAMKAKQEREWNAKHPIRAAIRKFLSR